MKAAGLDVPVVVGGIIPSEDEAKLTAAGIARIYTPKDFQLNLVLGEILDLVGPVSDAEFRCVNRRPR